MQPGRTLALRLSAVLAVITAIICMNSCNGSAFISSASLLPLVATLSELRSNLDAAEHTANGSVADRIHQLSVESEQRLKQLEALTKSAANRIDLSEQTVLSDVTNLTLRVNDEIQRDGFVTFVGVNNSLVNLARVLNGIPFVHTEPFVFAIDPYRILPDATDRLISFYGYFPDVNSDHPVTVTVKNRLIPLKEFVGNKVAFEVPSDAIKQQGEFLNMTLHIPRKRLGLYFGSQDVTARLYVGSVKPFTFTVKVYKDNPELWANVSNAGFLERADSGRTSVVQTLSARDLFSRLVNDNVNYDMETALLSTVNPHPAQSGPPCHCGCDSPYSRLDRWDAGSLSFSLAAPSCAAHMCSIFDSCGGGGTWAEMRLDLAFRVKRRGVSNSVPSTSQEFAMSRGSIQDTRPLGADWATVEILGKFVDGQEHFEELRTLQRARMSDNSLQTTALLWQGSLGVDGNTIHIETR